MKSKFFAEFDSFYFVGICGVSMSALAQFAVAARKKVGGSDRDLSSAGRLRALGIKVNGGGTRALADYDVVVCTDAVGRCDPELKLARALGKPVISRGKLLADVCGNFSRTVAVSGCHGKTTCTAMLASAFFAAGARFGAHIGGMAAGFGNFYLSGNDLFITEACEYKKNFMLLSPDTAVVLNTDTDHLECYSDEEELRACYAKFAMRAGTAVVPAGSGLASLGNAVTFGGGGDFRAEEVVQERGNYSFTLVAYGKRECTVKLAVPGEHNVNNALAAAAAARAEGLGFGDICRGLCSFRGVERRMQLIGRLHGARCVADYAHHPAEIASAIKTATSFTEGRLFVIFQPHTYSRTKNLFPQFVGVLSGVQKLLIYRTFAAREYFDCEGSALTLSRAVRSSRYGDSPEDILKFVFGAKPGDTILFLGAGDIYFIARSLLEACA